MKSKSVILSVFLCLILIACDSSMLIKVDLSDDLSNQNYSLIDYDFTLANSDNSDKLYFEFITNKELEQSTAITFFDQSGNVVAAKKTGSANSLISENIELSGERSFAYSINLDGLRSVSLVHEVIIGKK